MHTVSQAEKQGEQQMVIAARSANPKTGDTSEAGNYVLLMFAASLVILGCIALFVDRKRA